MLGWSGKPGGLIKAVAPDGSHAWVDEKWKALFEQRGMEAARKEANAEELELSQRKAKELQIGPFDLASLSPHDIGFTKDPTSQKYTVAFVNDLAVLEECCARADVLLVNLGVHWNDETRQHYRRSLAATLARLAAFNRPPAGSASRQLALFRETLPQHFASRDGSGSFSARIGASCAPLGRAAARLAQPPV